MSTRLTLSIEGWVDAISHLHLTRIVQKAHRENALNLLKNPPCMCAHVWMQQLKPKLSLGWAKTLCSAPETGRRRSTCPKAVVLLGSDTGCCLIQHQRQEHAWSTDYPLSLPFQWKTEGWQAFLISTASLWKMAILYWYRLEILILKVCKFNSKQTDIFVCCIQVLWDF